MKSFADFHVNINTPSHDFVLQLESDDVLLDELIQRCSKDPRTARKASSNVSSKKRKLEEPIDHIQPEEKNKENENVQVNSSSKSSINPLNPSTKCLQKQNLRIQQPKPKPVLYRILRSLLTLKGL